MKKNNRNMRQIGRTYLFYFHDLLREHAIQHTVNIILIVYVLNLIIHQILKVKSCSAKIMPNRYEKCGFDLPLSGVKPTTFLRSPKV